MTVYLALYKGRGKIGNAAVRLWTRSVYSHCELVADGVSYSSSIMDGGVRSKIIEFDDGNWDLVALPEHFSDRITSHYSSTIGTPYGWVDLLRSQVFNTGANDTGRAFCSEWCADALGLPNPTIYNPGTLGELIRTLVAPPWTEINI